MIKLHLLFLLPLLLLSESSMKCAPGKCASGEPSMTKEIPKKEINSSQMKCAPGKCASGEASSFKDIPQKTTETLDMKCAPGKCGQGSSSMPKSLPKKTDARSNRPTIKQLFNVKTIQVKGINSAKQQVNYGYITAQDSLRIDVFAWYSGFVETLYADTLYKKVNKGDLLAKVYSPEVFQAKQDYLNSINYNLDHDAPAMLQSTMTKLTLLGVSEKEIQGIKTQRKVSEFTMIYAPMSGWIFEKNINQGSSFNSKKKLFEIVNLEEVWAEVKLFQNELQNLNMLENFKVIIKGIETSYPAKKSLLYPVIDPKETTAILRLIVKNENEFLKPGMYVKVHASSQETSRIVIPRTAAIRKNGSWYAFLATEFKGEYEPIEIRIKPLDTRHFEVLEGLTTSDTVVNNALFMMDSDAQINSIY